MIWIDAGQLSNLNPAVTLRAASPDLALLKDFRWHPHGSPTSRGQPGRSDAPMHPGRHCQGGSHGPSCIRIPGDARPCPRLAFQDPGSARGFRARWRAGAGAIDAR